MPPETEAQMHQAIVDYIRLQYPEAIFRTDWGAGARVTPKQRVEQKRLQQDRAYPDLFIAEPRSGFHGLFLELKRENTRIFKLDGTYVKDAHIREQANVLYNLSCRGYLATWGVGFDHAREVIDTYMELPKPNYKPPEWSIEIPQPKSKPKIKDDGKVF